MHSSCVVEEASSFGPGDPWDVFSALAILVVEGRTPGGEKGCYSGPHCPHPHQGLPIKHICHDSLPLCTRAESLIKQLRVMWGARVDVNVEVLVAPSCEHGVSMTKHLDTSFTPAKDAELLEQWNFTIYDKRIPEVTTNGWSLLAAVRSFLHFSQLSAWLSLSQGKSPPNILYRLTVSSPVFSSKFSSQAELHQFPVASLGRQTSIKVSVQSLQRKHFFPIPVCSQPHPDPHLASKDVPSNDKHQHDQLKASSSSLLENMKIEDDLRRSLMKARLEESSWVSSDSSDIQLGESLLDPPSSLSRFPKRFHSPSRSRSPSLETPEHLICRPRHANTSHLQSSGSGDMTSSHTPHNYIWTQTRYPSSSTNMCSSHANPFRCQSRNPHLSLSKDTLPQQRSYQVLSQQSKAFKRVLNSELPHKVALGRPSPSCPGGHSSPLPRDCGSTFPLEGQAYAGQPDDLKHRAGDGSKRDNYCLSSSKNVEQQQDEAVDDDNLAPKLASNAQVEIARNSNALKTDAVLCGVVKAECSISDNPGHRCSEVRADCHVISVKNTTENEETPLKVHFELTPKETREILTVLRQSRYGSCCSENFITSKNCSLLRTKQKCMDNEGDDIEPLRKSPKLEIRPLDGPVSLECEDKSVQLQRASSGDIHDERKSSNDTSSCKILDLEESSKGHSAISSSCVKHGKCTSDFPHTNFDNVVSMEAEETMQNVANNESSDKSLTVNDTPLVKSYLASAPYHLNKPISNSKICAKESKIQYSRENVKRALQFNEQESSSDVIPLPGVSTREIEEHSNTVLKRTYSSLRDSAKSKTEESVEDPKGTDVSHKRKVAVPTENEKLRFQQSLNSATNLVFHRRTGLPLTSSPAPLRKKGTRFDFDSDLNSVAAIKRSSSFYCSPLFLGENEDDSGNLDYPFDTESSNCQSVILSASAPAKLTCSSLLGNFEECVLNGRLDPVSTVHGFKAEIAASGSFCLKHITRPVTVFFYTLCDNDQISSPYMGHIDLGKKGYHIPNKGTVQVTLFNPLRTVVKMFVVMYDLSDMPPNSRTFLRQRTLNMPVNASDCDPDAYQWLRYLIHLRFASSKSGKIYLHTDIRMLILLKSDADAATLHKTSVPYELRSFTHGPKNPKFSPRK